MFKKIILLIMLLAVAAFVSGCIDDKTGNNTVNKTDTIKYEQIPTVNLPSGITFIGVTETYVQIGNSSRKAIEGIYKTDIDDLDVNIDIFNTETPQVLIDEYKSQYKNASYNPFTEIPLNGHNATQVLRYRTKNGTQIPIYSVIWTTKDSMIKVGPSTDAQKVINLATATNS